ncbi:AlbA family DNA-binding domain-containing protein [Chryseobacterium sp. 22458]|uniref:AlbA family DNA-binding domain-containing protein n=1 Tax=Chryseobacterium sp. 22458 TaxID=3453921 RepID=UPI003F846261
MKTEELEHLLEGRKEHPSLDFKAACFWDVKKLTRDILAMSNLPDGGHIVIGVEEVDNSFVRKGVESQHCNTFILDEMKDQVGKYADPMVDFDVHIVEDVNGLKYVVIKVYSFRETPTICKRDLDKELRASTIYYRNTNRRVESAAVSNVNDLRDIIELAAVRLMQRRQSFGFIVPDNDHEFYKKEITALSKMSIVEKIKKKGYLEISITPIVKSSLPSLFSCLEAVEKAQVKLFWNFPFIPRNNFEGSVDVAENCYQGTSDNGARKEIWRMHLSEHYYMINALVEDWMEGDILRGGFAKTFLSGSHFFFYTSLLHPLTQLFEFIKRLAIQGLYKKGARVSIAYRNMADRELHLDDGERIPFARKRRTKANDIVINEEYNQAELVSASMTLASDAILKVCEYFQYHPSADLILADQLGFLDRK